MSVKGKVKRLNRELIKLRDDLETVRQKQDKQTESSIYTRQLENIVKFAKINHIGNLRRRMQIERYEIDKMQDLRLCPLAPELYLLCDKKCEECEYPKDFIEALEERSK